MKSTALTLALFLTSAKVLLGFTEVNEGELYLETRFSAQQDSNITGSSIGSSDFILSVDPTLVWERNRRGTIAASLGMNLSRFEKFGEFDAEDLHGAFSLTFPVAQGSPFSGGFNAGYTERTSVDYFVGNRVATESSNLGLSGQYRLRQRLSVRGDLSYQDRNATNYSDTIDESARVGFIIEEIWQKVGVTVDYRLRKLKTSGDIGLSRDYSDNAIFVGLTGQLLPESKFKKLEAYASVSVQKVDSSRTGFGVGDRDVIGYDGSLSWEASPTTNVSLSFNKDLQNTVDDEPVESSDITLGVSKQLSRRMTGNLNVFTRNIGYFGGNRTDDAIGGGMGLDYLLGRNWTAGLTLTYVDTNSNEDFFRYDRLTFGIFSLFKF